MNGRDNAGLRKLDAALSAGDLEGARETLFRLTEDERDVLRVRLGDEGLDRLYRSARRRRRATPEGRVVVLPGLLGTQIDSLDKTGDSDRIWFNAFRILGGRIGELQLAQDGSALPPPPTIITDGPYPSVYMPLLMELMERWQVMPFGYDWRIDIDRSAAALAQVVKSWAKGEPAHLLVHSMGGLVARRFIQLFPDLWSSMQDPDGAGRGGRLVMMGTPNRGSFAIALALSGEERLVKMLAKIDLTRDANELLRVLNTFPGSYQTLPSPKVILGDDHVKLFDAASWGRLPVFAGLLAMGRRFQETLHPVLTPERLVYVAGFGQETPSAVTIKAPGVFEYETTLEGDGRVPHELGLLEGVPTLFVREKHGDLVKNSRVLAGVHDLLLHGTTSTLDTSLPPVRGRATRTRSAPEMSAVPEAEMREVDALVERLREERRSPVRTHEQELAAARLEALALADYQGEPPRGARGGRAVGPTPGALRSAQRRGPVPKLPVEVVWGDISKVAGNVYVAGQYAGVLPQAAVAALDREISKGSKRLVLADQVRRGLIRGGLGDVEFFPWRAGRVVALAGMGHPGTFGESQLRRLGRNLTWALSNLPASRTVCSLLIGSGAGNLTAQAALRALFAGLADALGDEGFTTSIRRLRLVEIGYERAHEIHRLLGALKEEPALASRLQVILAPTVMPGAGRDVGRDDAFTLAIGAAARAARGGASSKRPLLAVMRSLPRERPIAERVLEHLTNLEPGAARRLRISPDRAETASANVVPTRISFVQDTGCVRAAAITDTATVAERTVVFDLKLVDELVERMTDPEASVVPDLSRLLRRLLVPRDFGSVFEGSRPFVFELDRAMARVHWEMLSAGTAGDDAPLGATAVVSRQLRTAYSAPPAPQMRDGRIHRALVVGDPGDPDEGHSLAGARREAQEVAALLRTHGLDVTELIGAPDALGNGPLPGVRPASRLEVLRLLLDGGFDLLHYAGHGDFDPQHPERVGWVFKGGLLTARELERMDRAPRLVVANACLSALTSDVTPTGSSAARVSDTDLLPSLADEFFHRGVRDYVGTAWEVSDEGAIRFAQALYESVLPRSDGRAAASVGEGMLAARRALLASTDVYGALWAAYQHYGDPAARLDELTAAAGEPLAPKKGGRSRKARIRAR
jgi:pimeloyl-ACP methyl ester carboxylesterase